LTLLELQFNQSINQSIRSFLYSYAPSALSFSHVYPSVYVLYMLSAWKLQQIIWNLYTRLRTLKQSRSSISDFTTVLGLELCPLIFRIIPVYFSWKQREWATVSYRHILPYFLLILCLMHNFVHGKFCSKHIHLHCRAIYIFPKWRRQLLISKSIN
jgi:hypothetical protein